MTFIDGTAWRWHLFRRRWFLATTFRNGVPLALAHRNRQPMARAVCWDGTEILHPPDRLGLPETLIEVWHDKVYTRDFYQPMPGDRIIDAGANVGLFTLWMARQVRCRIVAFEPFEQNYQFLLQNLSAAGLGWVDAKQAGLSGVSGHATMRTMASRSLDHRLIPVDAHDRDANDRSVRIPTYSLAQAVALAGDEVDFCKLDIEGSERDVFEAADEKTLWQVRRFAIEYHDNIRPGTLQLLRQRLAATHDLRIEPSAGGYGMIYSRRRDLASAGDRPAG